MSGSTRFTLMALHVVCAAGTYVMSKLAADGFASPAALTLARALATTLVLLALTGTVIPRPDFDGRTWLALLALGALIVPVNQLFFLAGLKDSVPGHAALLYALTPLGVLSLSSLIERRAPGRAMLGGVLLAFAGTMLVLRPWESGEDAARIRHGDLLLLAAVAAWAIYTVAIRPLCRRHDPRTVTAWSLILGTLTMMPLGGRALKTTDFAAIPEHSWWGLLWMVGIASVTMMMMWAALLRHLHPVQVAICMNAQPPATALLQMALTALGVWSALGLAQVEQTLGLAFFGGMVLVIAGVALVQRPAPAVASRPEDAGTPV